MPAMLMAHDIDPKQDLLDKLGNLDNFELFHNQVLCAVYIRPQKTKSGILLVDSTRDEDRNQSKIGLIVKCGNQAFQSDKEWQWPDDFGTGDWALYRASDGWPTTIVGVNGDKVLCRILDDVRVRGRISHPDQIW